MSAGKFDCMWVAELWVTRRGNSQRSFDRGIDKGIDAVTVSFLRDRDTGVTELE
jgi:hypothetical protein